MKYKEMQALAMPKSKIKEEKYNIIAYYVNRPLSYFITSPLLKTNITPNTVSFISLLSVIVGFILMCTPNSMYIRAIGCLFFILWSLLDSVDGNIARIKKMYSPNGDLWDSAAGYVAMALICFGMGICAFDYVNPGTIVYPILGGLSGMFCLYPRLLMHFKNASGGKNELNDKTAYGLKEILVMNITAPDGFILIFALVAIFMKIEWLFTIGYFILYLLVMLIACYRLLK